MGSWGKGSFENDTSMDFVDDIINRKALRKLASRKQIDWDHYDEARVSAEILLHLHKLKDLWVESDTIEGLVSILELAIADKEWHDSWCDERDSKDIVKQLKRFVKGLKNLEGY